MRPRVLLAISIPNNSWPAANVQHAHWSGAAFQHDSPTSSICVTPKHVHRRRYCHEPHPTAHQEVAHTASSRLVAYWRHEVDPCGLAAAAKFSVPVVQVETGTRFNLDAQRFHRAPGGFRWTHLPSSLPALGGGDMAQKSP